MSRTVSDHLVTVEGDSEDRGGMERFPWKYEVRREGSVVDDILIKQRPHPTEISCTSAERGSADTEACPL